MIVHSAEEAGSKNLSDLPKFAYQVGEEPGSEPKAVWPLALPLSPYFTLF